MGYGTAVVTGLLFVLWGLGLAGGTRARKRLREHVEAWLYLALAAIVLFGL